MHTIGGLQGGFDMARVMTNGGPAGSTTTLAYYLYQRGFMDFQLGLASAIAWTMFAVIFMLTIINWRFGNKMVND
jgi:multiple sugar transport system permease protein